MANRSAEYTQPRRADVWDFSGLTVDTLYIQSDFMLRMSGITKDYSRGIASQHQVHDAERATFLAQQIEAVRKNFSSEAQQLYKESDIKDPTSWEVSESECRATILSLHKEIVQHIFKVNRDSQTAYSIYSLLRQLVDHFSKLASILENKQPNQAIKGHTPMQNANVETLTSISSVEGTNWKTPAGQGQPLSSSAENFEPGFEATLAKAEQVVGFEEAPTLAQALIEVSAKKESESKNIQNTLPTGTSYEFSSPQPGKKFFVSLSGSTIGEQVRVTVYGRPVGCEMEKRAETGTLRIGSEKGSPATEVVMLDIPENWGQDIIVLVRSEVSEFLVDSQTSQLLTEVSQIVLPNNNEVGDLQVRTLEQTQTLISKLQTFWQKLAIKANMPAQYRDTRYNKLWSTKFTTAKIKLLESGSKNFIKLLNELSQTMENGEIDPNVFNASFSSLHLRIELLVSVLHELSEMYKIREAQIAGVMAKPVAVEHPAGSLIVEESIYPSLQAEEDAQTPLASDNPDLYAADYDLPLEQHVQRENPVTVFQAPATKEDAPNVVKEKVVKPRNTRRKLSPASEIVEAPQEQNHVEVIATPRPKLEVSVPPTISAAEQLNQIQINWGAYSLATFDFFIPAEGRVSRQKIGKSNFEMARSTDGNRLNLTEGLLQSITKYMLSKQEGQIEFVINPKPETSQPQWFRISFDVSSSENKNGTH